MRSGKFFPTEDNANKLETWNATGGHSPITCDESMVLSLGECAINCYLQWFSGSVSCPQHNMTTMEQYPIAKAKLLRYNIIIILERLRDPEYVSAVENFFGIPGVTVKRSAACVRLSRQANKEVPLVVKNETMRTLVDLNAVDTSLYKELTHCEGSNYRFPEFAPTRFASISV